MTPQHRQLQMLEIGVAYLEDKHNKLNDEIHANDKELMKVRFERDRLYQELKAGQETLFDPPTPNG